MNGNKKMLLRKKKSSKVSSNKRGEGGQKIKKSSKNLRDVKN